MIILTGQWLTITPWGAWQLWWQKYSIGRQVTLPFLERDELSKVCESPDNDFLLHKKQSPASGSNSLSLVPVLYPRAANLGLLWGRLLKLQASKAPLFQRHTKMPGFKAKVRKSHLWVKSPWTQTLVCWKSLNTQAGLEFLVYTSIPTPTGGTFVFIFQIWPVSSWRREAT